MACFFDWEDRGRFNFTPDRAGVILDVKDGNIERIVLAQRQQLADGSTLLDVKIVDVARGDTYDRALIGYSDLP